MNNPTSHQPRTLSLSLSPNCSFNPRKDSPANTLLLPIIFLGSFLVALACGSVFLSTASTSAAQVSGSSPVDIALTIDPVISITTDTTNGALSIPIDPTPAGTFGSGDLTVSVHTNNSTGYTLTMNSSTSSTALTHITLPTSTIPSITNTLASPSTLTTNTWGYSKWTAAQITSNTPPTAFARVPTLATPDTLTNTTNPTDSPNTKLTFAVNADSTIASGTYTNSIVLTATTNYVPIPPQCPVLIGKTYLQDIKTPTGPIYGQPNQRVVLKDRRNNQDYYVQNILNQDGTCTAWMETNLRYAGGGDNTYGDTKTLALRSTGQATYTTAEHMNPGGTDTLDTTTPTNNTNFYGYLYNWCAAMGGQTNACNDTSTTGFDTTISICPAGWRLPTGTYGGDFYKLNKAVNSGTSVSPQGLIDNFLAVYSGNYTSGLSYQGTRGRYWSSTVSIAMGAYSLDFRVTSVYFDTQGYKYDGYAVRCIL